MVHAQPLYDVLPIPFQAVGVFVEHRNLPQFLCGRAFCACSFGHVPSVHSVLDPHGFILPRPDPASFRRLLGCARYEHERRVAWILTCFSYIHGAV